MKTIIPLAIASLFAISCKPSNTVTAAAYPLDTCLVSGEKLGSMGEPPVLVHEGREIRFCCDSCIPKFKKEPEKYLSKLN